MTQIFTFYLIMTRLQLFEKRIFDVSMAIIGLIITAIPLCIIAVLVVVKSPASPFFKQLRIGRHGRLFQCIKFRTMYPESEKYGTVTMAEDKRITPIGRFLRKYKLDEIPQLWNVLTGNMSFVGPRPDMPGYADRLQGDDRRILELYPGITGPATLKFRNEEILLAQVPDPQRYNDEIIFPEKVRLNLEYIDHWSFWRDIGYIIMTIVPGFSCMVGLDKKLGLVEDKS